MQLPRTRALGVRVEWRDSVPSTNTALKALLDTHPHLPHGTVVVTDTQTAGRGRLDRSWSTPTGTSLAISVLIRGFMGAGIGLGWLPLIAGSAVTRALRPFVRGGSPGAPDIGVKWPNDVHVVQPDGTLGPKLSGVLCELQGDGSVIVGMGVNLLIAPEDLPTHRSGSLLSVGADVLGAVSFADEAGRELADRVLSGVVGELLKLVEQGLRDAHAIHRVIEADSVTIGTTVRAYLPTGEVVDGRASGLGEDGSLIIDRDGAEPFFATAGDVEHLRPQPEAQ